MIQLVELSVGSIKSIQYGDSIEEEEIHVSNRPTQTNRSIKSQSKIPFDKEILNKMRPALNKRKFARSKKLKNEKSYQKKLDDSLNTPEDLFLYSDRNFYPLSEHQGTSTAVTDEATTSFFNEPTEFENIDGYEELQKSYKTAEKTAPKESFGLAAKMSCPISRNKGSNSITSSFGFAARLRTAETDEEKAARILDQGPKLVKTNLTARNLPKIDGNDDESELVSGAVHLHINVKTKKGKRKGKGKK